jgi:hypothetical protein
VVLRVLRTERCQEGVQCGESGDVGNVGATGGIHAAHPCFGRLVAWHLSAGLGGGGPAAGHLLFLEDAHGGGAVEA